MTNQSTRFTAAAVLMAAVLALPACTFVKMAPGAKQVQVLTTAPTACEKRGEVEVSVKDRVGFYERNDLRVQDELETLARNEAPGLQANRISPLNPPTDGSQRFALWRCPG